MKNLALATLLTLTACGTATLKDFSESELKLEVLRDGQIQLVLSDAKGSCPVLGTEVRATLNGAEMVVESRGGEVSTANGWSCESPRFSLPKDALKGRASKDAFAVIDDTQGQIVLVAKNVFADRELAPTRYDEDLTGRKMTFKWIPETDTQRTASWQLEGATVSFGQATVDQDLLSVELPSGPGTLRLHAEASAPLTRCEAVGHCTVRIALSLDDVAVSGR